eukprot:13852322-Ditylum_brightwellii.AAC.1
MVNGEEVDLAKKKKNKGRNVQIGLQRCSLAPYPAQEGPVGGGAVGIKTGVRRSPVARGLIPLP